MSEPVEADTDGPRDPWERFGWLMGAVWLVFLAFPASTAVAADRPALWRALTVALVVTFAATYVVGFIRVTRAATWAEVGRRGLAGLGVLVVLLLLTVPTIEVQALGMVPFVVAFAMFSQPLARALAVGLLGLLGVVLVPLALGRYDETWHLTPIVVLVLVSTGLVRLLEQRRLEHREFRDALTVAAERDRLARDVHDVLGHSLTVVTVKAELAERLVDVDPERAKAELEQIRSLSREALAEIRATVSGLRVARLAEEVAAARTTLADAGIAAELPDDPSVVDPRHRIVLAWALREAVTNVVRHSQASACRVALGTDYLVVEDDGRGPGRRGDGQGLRGVRERVEGAGGTVSVGARPGGGTRLEVRL
ncbi:sensor histidine kinase [Ornithinimicrobium humiphilum]|uniref:Two-component system sensor histidine kinase DesK n=1 Tax=Ornithinimicrobium humiphilum TaxID=125288 RepID=A0A543KL67_9MICO|nr:histidine kinase [Ornithinimicrobium humiphilum]TQM95770.1 two-component system sensor histidine kinase DesK [Ornithinimicrobium humiphilum]